MMAAFPRWLKYVAGGVLSLPLWGLFVWVFPSPGAIFGHTAAAAVLPAAVIAGGVDLSQILSRLDSQQTSLAQQDFLSSYQGAPVYGVGTFIDIGKSGSGYFVPFRLVNRLVRCGFADKSADIRKILLLQKEQTVGFSGTFTGAMDLDGAWFIQNCTLGKVAH